MGEVQGSGRLTRHACMHTPLWMHAWTARAQKFNARYLASSRVYEYYLPGKLLGGFLTGAGQREAMG